MSRAVVIGAGVNGLTAAALLARDGRSVTVVERRDVVGGLAAAEEFHPGYSTVGALHDTTGFRSWIEDALELRKHGLVRRPAPAIFAPQENGRGLLLHADTQRAREEIAAHSARDADRYVEYREFLERIGGFVRRVLDAVPPDPSRADGGALLGLASTGWALRRLGRGTMMEVLRLGPMCVADWLNEWFETELLSSALAVPAVFGGFVGPWSPATNSLLVRQAVCSGDAVQGGPPALSAALERAARAQGAEIRTESAVTEIRIEKGRVRGVALEGGEELEAPTVVATCDPKTTFLRLIPRSHRLGNLTRRLEAYRSQGTTGKVHLALRGPLRFAGRPELQPELVRTAQTLDEMEQAFDPVKYGRFAEAPVLDVHVGSAANGGTAPDGHTVVSVLAHAAPHDLAGGWTEDARERFGDAVVAALARYAPDLPSLIVAREVLAPPDLEARFGVWGGHLDHGEQALDQLIARPCPECARYETPYPGLWLGGSGSWPGGGLLGAPGALAAAAVAQSA